MQHILIAVFENRSDAEHARDELLASGFSKQEVKISRADATGQTDSLTGRSTDVVAESPHPEGFIGNIRHFFHDLFGTDTSPHAQKYTDAVGRGHHVLTVSAADEPEVERAADIVERHGPVDIDERAEQWAGGAAMARPEAMRMSGAGGLQQSAPAAAQSDLSRSGSQNPGSQSGLTGQSASGWRAGLSQETGTPMAENRNPFGTQSLQDATPMGGTYQEPMAGGGNLSSGTTTGAQHQGSVPWPGQGGSMQRDTSSWSSGGMAPRESIGARDVQKGGVRVYSGTAADDSYYRSDWQRRFGSGGGSYEDYAPAYGYGAEMARNDKYRGRDWTDIETDLRTGWESRAGVSGQPSTWDKMKDAVRSGWDRITGQADADAAWRQDWTSNYAASGGTYDEYAPAYRYGYDAAHSDRYRGRTWSEIESDLRRDWDARYATSGQPSTWDKMKAAVRHGWERMTSDTDNDAYYRNDWNSKYASTGGLYDEYAPAYRYGSEKRDSDAYRGRDWHAAESDLKSDWETRYGSGAGSTWERFKASIRHGWERMTGDTDTTWRSHWSNTYGAGAGTYDEYAPAYRYGAEMRGSDKYRGRDWNEVESDLRSDWDTRYAGSTGSSWERFKAAIREGWDRMTS